MKNYCYYDSPIGRMLLVGREGVLHELYFPNVTATKTVPAEWVLDEAAFVEPLRQLREYFAGRRREFDLVVDPQGTPFQKEVWRELCRIPYGQTASYQAIAERLGKPRPAGQSAWPTAGTRCRSSSPATASSARTEP